MDGRGVFRYAHGDVYEGEFKDDKKHGRGVYYMLMATCAKENSRTVRVMVEECIDVLTALSSTMASGWTVNLAKLIIF